MKTLFAVLFFLPAIGLSMHGIKLVEKLTYGPYLIKPGYTSHVQVKFTHDPQTYHVNMWGQASIGFMQMKLDVLSAAKAGNIPVSISVSEINGYPEIIGITLE